jgi:hypothetical protein
MAQLAIEAAAAKNSVTMRALALSIAKANTRAGKIKAGIKLGAIYGIRASTSGLITSSLGGLTLLNAEPERVVYLSTTNCPVY